MIPDCQACAACCHAAHERHVPVTGADHARLLPDEQARLSWWDGNRCFLRTDAGRCAALGRDGAGRWSCTIYERRPEVCRDLERGSPACEAAIEGVEP